MLIHVGEIEVRRHLRSAAGGHLVVPTTMNKRHGSHIVAVSGSFVWISLPLAARELELTSLAFRKLLKNELFGRAYTTS